MNTYKLIAILLAFHVLQVFQGQAWITKDDLDLTKYECEFGFCHKKEVLK